MKIKQTHEGMIFQSGGYLFKSFIEDMYARRMRAKEAKDEVNDTIAKLMMNSLYGRMGLNREREDIVIDDGRLEATPVEYIPDIVKRGFGFRLIRTPSYLHSSFSNVAIAWFGTSRMPDRPETNNCSKHTKNTINSQQRHMTENRCSRYRKKQLLAVQLEREIPNRIGNF